MLNFFKSMTETIIEKKSWKESFGENSTRLTHLRDNILKRVKTYLKGK